jgi:Rps23 Pro-64 3,4-dihydroxylase Tpa1-like proline 4-hydroxylase
MFHIVVIIIVDDIKLTIKLSMKYEVWRKWLKAEHGGRLRKFDDQQSVRLSLSKP